jgi:Domain of unknown function (DUF4397)
LNGCCTTGEPAIRIVNAFTTPVQVLIDGSLAVASLPAGAIDTLASASGNHTLVLRPVGSGASASQSITATTGALSTVAIVRASNGAIAAAVLDDTNSVVPPGATKVRVLHLAPNAGTIQVYRTQPDYQQPVSWQFPFDYQPEPTSITAPFYRARSGAGTFASGKRRPMRRVGRTHPIGSSFRSRVARRGRSSSSTSPAAAFASSCSRITRADVMALAQYAATLST